MGADAAPETVLAVGASPVIVSCVAAGFEAPQAAAVRARAAIQTSGATRPTNSIAPTLNDPRRVVKTMPKIQLPQRCVAPMVRIAKPTDGDGKRHCEADDEARRCCVCERIVSTQRREAERDAEAVLAVVPTR